MFGNKAVKKAMEKERQAQDEKKAEFGTTYIVRNEFSIDRETTEKLISEGFKKHKEFYFLFKAFGSKAEAEQEILRLNICVNNLFIYETNGKDYPV